MEIQNIVRDALVKIEVKITEKDLNKFSKFIQIMHEERVNTGIHLADIPFTKLYLSYRNKFIYYCYKQWERIQNPDLWD